MNIFLSDQTKIFLAARSISLDINLHPPRRFFYESSEINFLACFIYSVYCWSSKTTRRIEKLEIPALFVIFWTFHCVFLSTFFFVSEIMDLLRTVRILPGICIPEVVPVSWNWFQAFKNFFRHTLSRFTISLLGTQAILRATIWSHFALLTITCQIPERN